ncbi:MAG: carboxypeptidase regulatory-like domain-containing protein [Acidobacteria bacterium]|nr:MAG: carboxypeptidase regulatory-like domain-containing protein [Acidobacteriota bacterium]
MRSVRRAILMASAVLMLSALLCEAALAQEVTGSITGTIVDSSGGAIPGATVTLLSEQTGATRTVVTDDMGDFVFAAVRPGIYTVTAEMPGFKKLQKQGFELTPGGSLPVGRLQLEVGEVSELVTVRAEGALVQTTTSERAGITTSDEIKDLTVMNRDFSVFASLQPGIVVNIGAEVQSFTGNTTFHALGGRTTGNMIIMDGAPTSNSNQGNMNTTLSLDTVQSVEVKIANFQAEYGRSQGVTIMAVSKGGTRDFHGTGYYYKRHEMFNANSFFNNRSGLKETPYRITTAGGNLSGPFHIPHVDSTKGKLFFLFASEEIREKRPKTPQNVTVPTELERAGDFSKSTISGKAVTVKDPLTGKAFPGNIVPPDRILASTQNYLKLLPLANMLDTAITKGEYNYTFQESLTVPKRIETLRVDYVMNDQTTLFGRFNYWWEDQRGASVSAGNSAWGWLPAHYTAITPSYVLSLTHVFNPTMVLQSSAGVQRFQEAGPPLDEADVAAKSRKATGVDIPQFNPSINPYNLVPAASFGGVRNPANPSYATRFPLKGAETTIHSNTSISKIFPGHTLKGGFYLERWQVMKGEQATFAGTMNFGTDSNNPQDTGYAYSNALLGILTSYVESSSRSPMYEYTTSLEWYGQDTWKVSPKLTLDLGLRFGWSQPWHDNENLEAGFVPSLWKSGDAIKLIEPTLVNNKRMGKNPHTGEILPAVYIGAIAPGQGNPFNGIIYRKDNPDYPQGLRYTDGVKAMPRLGFAWDPFGQGKTVIRGGGGLFYSIHDRDNYQSAIQMTPPIQYNSQINYTTVQTFADSAGYIFPSNIQGYDPDRRIQQTMNFSLGFQQDVGFGTVVDVAYVGALGRHLVVRRNLNTTPLGTNFLPSSKDPTRNAVLPSQFLRPYVGYGDIQYYYFGGNSSYHSLQTAIRRRYTSGLYYGVIWTWSKAMDYADEDYTGNSQVSSVVDQKIWNYGRAGFDRTHIFRLYWSYNIPSLHRFWDNPFTKAVLDDWQVSGIATFQSGAPLGISYSFTPARDTTGSTDGGRVMIVGNPVLPKDQRTFSAHFNTAAIAAPAVESWGNAPKDVFRGPGTNNWDISLFKNIPLYSERLSAQFRVEAYNVFNHTQFSAVNTSASFDANGNQTNLAFGQYTNTANPRRLQLALRLMF